MEADVLRACAPEARREVLGRQRARASEQVHQVAGVPRGLRVQDSDRGASHAVTLAHRTEVDLTQLRAYIGLGANVGDARATLTDAVAALVSVPGAHVHGVSRLYRTAPVGVTGQPDFLNAVVALDLPVVADAATGAIDLLVALKGLERDFGRRHRGRWGPRELDLDLLMYGQNRIVVERPDNAKPLSSLLDPAAAGRLLEVPHPQMRERLFVLAPFADLAPELVPPGWDESIEAARARRAAVEGPDAVRPVGTWGEEERTWIGPTGGPISVDRAALDDAAEMARVHTAAATAAYRGLVRAEADPVARRTRMWQEILSNPGHGAFVARDAGRIVGVLSIGGFRDTPGVGAVHVLYVLEPWWGSGTGQLLMDHAHAELATSYGEAELTVLTANARARRFYERNGWVEADTVIEPHFGDVPTKVTRYRRSLRRLTAGGNARDDS
jgi:2-amino-4-hydroxy-6-hydroxymethyldihydropteridine diphosphokinase